MTFRIVYLLLLVLVLCQTRSIDNCGTSLARHHKRSPTQIVVMHPDFTFPNKRENTRPKMWDRWTKWSSCSVSCGAGKITRWRHCIAGGCAPGEKEAQIKTCRLNPC